MAASSLYILYKTPFEKTGCIVKPYFYLLVAYGSSFLIRPNTVMLPIVMYPSLCSTCVTYRTLCRAIGQQVLPTLTHT